MNTIGLCSQELAELICNGGSEEQLREALKETLDSCFLPKGTTPSSSVEEGSDIIALLMKENYSLESFNNFLEVGKNLLEGEKNNKKKLNIILMLLDTYHVCCQEEKMTCQKQEHQEDSQASEKSTGPTGSENSH